ncbi:MAG: hypothetical protein KJ950_11115 [Proteobacteria bacterium]|nr:hypothetical protein [Pseudomonadota bacterium]MBU1687691.1 hypothetical protein [Pseudomonadota bacterium]
MFLNKSDLKETCQELLNDFGGASSWEWDKGFNALVAEFSAEGHEEIRTKLKHHLSLEWDHKSIRKAPEKIQTATGDFGDLRANQLLFTSDPEGDVFIFAAWWPWNNGEVISVRIASPAPGENYQGNQGVLAKIKSFFN